ncbi:MAG: YiiX family permuted papain-like enzyme [Bacteroidetes bacterium]|nr:MAG: YiiX family permuted papain-like enzyme [Bacteroidota bacterium]
MKKWTRLVSISLITLSLSGYAGSNTACSGRETRKNTGFAPVAPTLQNGDIIFQTSRSSQSQAIQLATGSKYSHMGILYQEYGKLYVYEAVQPVKRTPLQSWIDRGADGHFVVKRLKDADRVLTPEVLKKMRSAGSKYEGRDYDIYFGWSDEKMYCSELVWKIYKEAAGIEIGQLERLADFDLSSAPVRQKMKERYGDQVPLDEKVISPAAMFNAAELVTVLEK